jgi:hypothetical protein
MASTSTLDGVTIQSCLQQGVKLFDGAKATIQGGSVLDGNALGGILNYGDLTMTGGAVTNNDSGIDNVDDAKVTLENVEIAYNGKSSPSFQNPGVGAGVSFGANGGAHLTTGTIHGCTIHDNYNGVLLLSSTCSRQDVTLEDTEIAGSVVNGAPSAYLGDGVLVTAGNFFMCSNEQTKLTVAGGAIHDNAESGIYVDSYDVHGAIVSLDGVSLLDNAGGAGLWVTGDGNETTTVRNTESSGNAYGVLVDVDGALIDFGDSITAGGNSFHDNVAYQLADNRLSPGVAISAVGTSLGCGGCVAPSPGQLVGPGPVDTAPLLRIAGGNVIQF